MENIFGTFSQEDSSIILNQYEILSKADSGTYGTVYKCRDLQTGDFVAVKEFFSTGQSEQE